MLKLTVKLQDKINSNFPMITMYSASFAYPVIFIDSFLSNLFSYCQHPHSIHLTLNIEQHVLCIVDTRSQFYRCHNLEKTKFLF